MLAKMKGAGVPCARIGTTGGDAIAVAGETPVSVSVAARPASRAGFRPIWAVPGRQGRPEAKLWRVAEA